MDSCRRTKTIIRGIAIAAMLLAVCGCSSKRDWKFADMFDLKKGMPWHDDGPETEVPTRVVGTWTDTVLRQAGRKPQRGFGGRLLFYNDESNNPVHVDGQLVVYAFDETDREPTDNKPTRRYVFPTEQVPQHMSESELGPSYSFWLPWDELGGPQAEVSLICRFEPKDGALIVGEQTKHMLPGAMIAKTGPTKLPEGVPFKPGNQQALYSTSSQAGGNPMQETSFERPMASGPAAGASPAPERRMQTTSISLPASFHIQGSPASVQAGRATSRNEEAVPNISVPQQYAPQQNAGGVSGAGNPASFVAPTPYGQPTSPPTTAPQTRMQPVTPVGTSALSPSGQQSIAPQGWPPYAEQQPESTVPNGLSTTVTMLTPGESARRRWGQPSLNSTPASPPVPTPPISR